MKIVRTDAEIYLPEVDARLQAMGHDLVLLREDVSQADLQLALSDADILLMCYTPITRVTIEAATNLKGIIKYGVGIDAIDIDAAKNNNIVVVNIPDYGSETVAEGAFAMLLALAKKLIPLDRKMHSDGWAWPEPQWLGSDIAGKTVGLIGFGKIAKSMARMAGAGFRAKVIAYSPHTCAQEMESHGVQKVEDLCTLMASSDFVSVHCVLTPETHHLIGPVEIAAMKPDAFLINVARGAIVDEHALLHALQQQQIAGAGLDVFSQEPLKLHSHPLSALFTQESVILSPHLTFYTQDAMQRLEAETLERCMEIINSTKVTIKSGDHRLSGQERTAVYP